MDLNARIYKYLEYKGITAKEMETRASLSNGAVSKMGDGTRRSTIDKVSNAFPDLNTAWLLTGEGDMLIGDASITNNGTSQQVAQNVRGHVTQSVTSDLTSTITELTDIIKQSQELASKEQSQTTALIQQLANSQQQISELIQLLKEK